MCQRGEIPSAAQFGRTWTVRADALAQWITMKERTWMETSTSEARPTGAESGFKAKSIDAAYAQLMKQRPAPR
jgi:hypothetical protein